MTIKLLLFTLAFVAGYIVNEHTRSDHITPVLHQVEGATQAVHADLVALQRHLQSVERREQQMFQLFDRLTGLIDTSEVAHSNWIDYNWYMNRQAQLTQQLQTITHRLQLAETATRTHPGNTRVLDRLHELQHQHRSMQIRLGLYQQLTTTHWHHTHHVHHIEQQHSSDRLRRFTNSNQIRAESGERIGQTQESLTIHNSQVHTHAHPSCNSWCQHRWDSIACRTISNRTFFPILFRKWATQTPHH